MNVQMSSETSSTENSVSGEVRPPSTNFITPLAVGLDYLSIAAGTATGLLLYQSFGGAYVNNEGLKLLAFSIQYAIAFVLFGKIHYLYSHSHSLLQVRETAGILRISFFCLALLSVGIFFSKIIVPRMLLLLSWAFITLFVLLQKHVMRKVLAKLKAQSSKESRILIVGSGSEARRVFSFLLNSPDLQMKPIGFFEEQDRSSGRVIYSHDYQFRDHAPVFGGELDGEFLRRLNLSEIFVADENLSSQKLEQLTSVANQQGIQLSFVRSPQPHLAGRLSSLREMDGLLISSFSRNVSNPLGFYEISKRVLDVLGSLSIILVSLPVWLLVPVWIKLTSEGPVFFKQQRIGRSGKPFDMFKFRSMYVTAPKYGRSPEDPSDPRITVAGRFLRKSSLDELPQLINVLRGEMALVGPRPEMPYVVSQYDAHQAQRLTVQQGLTGIWQLSADRKFAIHESIEYDLYYIENRGFFLDLAVILHTVAFAMKGV